MNNRARNIRVPYTRLDYTKLEKFDVHRKSLTIVLLFHPRQMLKIYYKRFYDGTYEATLSK